MLLLELANESSKMVELFLVVVGCLLGVRAIVLCLCSPLLGFWWIFSGLKALYGYAVDAVFEFTLQFHDGVVGLRCNAGPKHVASLPCRAGI